MIVVDSSALLAILQGEPDAEACREALAAHEELLIAAPTLTEALIVSAGRGLRDQANELVEQLELTVVPLTERRARAAAEHYLRWGKSYHPAKLNFADSFAYAAAKEHDCPLLFVGNDFAKTDVAKAIG